MSCRAALSLPDRLIYRGPMSCVQLGEVAVTAPRISEADMGFVSAVKEIDEHMGKTSDVFAVVPIGVEPLAGREEGAADRAGITGRIEPEALEVCEAVTARP